MHCSLPGFQKEMKKLSVLFRSYFDTYFSRKEGDADGRTILPFILLIVYILQAQS